MNTLRLSAIGIMMWATGCATLSTLLGPDLTSDEIRAAIVRGDRELLRRACAGEVGASSSDRGDACRYERAAAIPEEMKQATCDTWVTVFERQTAAARNSSGQRDYMLLERSATAASEKLADCENWTPIFERVLTFDHEGKDSGAILKQLESAQKPVERELVKYLSTHRGPDYFAAPSAEEGVYALAGVTWWLTQASHQDHCRDFAAAANGADARRIDGSLDYFLKAKCQDAASVIAQNLATDDWASRRNACRALGLLGDGPIAELEQLANTDPYIHAGEEGGVISASRPVRSACREALARIRAAKGPR